MSQILNRYAESIELLDVVKYSVDKIFNKLKDATDEASLRHLVLLKGDVKELEERLKQRLKMLTTQEDTVLDNFFEGLKSKTN